MILITYYYYYHYYYHKLIQSFNEEQIAISPKTQWGSESTGENEIKEMKRKYRTINSEENIYLILIQKCKYLMNSQLNLVKNSTQIQIQYWL